MKANVTKELVVTTEDRKTMVRFMDAVVRLMGGDFDVAEDHYMSLFLSIVDGDKIYAIPGCDIININYVEEEKESD